MKRPISPQVSPRRTPTFAEISLRAFEIWQAQGCPDGSDRENWFEAERQLSEQGTYDDARDPSPTERDVASSGSPLSRAEFPVPFEESVPLASRVEKEVKPTPVRPESRPSKTSFEL